MNLSQAGKACFCPRPSVVVDSVHSCDWCVQSSLGDFRNRFYALCSAVRELRFKFLAHTLGARLKLYEEVGTQMPEAIRADPESDRDAMKALKRNFSTERRMSVELAAGLKRALVAVPENSKIQEADLSETFTNEFLEPR